MSAVINKLLAQTRKAVETYESRAEEERQFLALLSGLAQWLPPDLPYTKVHQHCCYADAVICLTVPKYANARGLLETLTPVPAVKEQNACLSLKPASLPAKERSERTPIFGMWATFNNVTNPEAELTWFAQLGGRLVRCDCRVESVHELASWSGHKSVQHGQVVMTNKAFRHKLTGKRINWWSPPDGHMRVTVWWPEETKLDEVFHVVDAFGYSNQ